MLKMLEAAVARPVLYASLQQGTELKWSPGPEGINITSVSVRMMPRRHNDTTYVAFFNVSR